MPRKAKTIPQVDPNDLIGELIEDLNNTTDEIPYGPTAADPPPPPPPSGKVSFDLEEISRKRRELLTLAEDGEIPQKLAYVNKASAKVIDRVYTEYEARCSEKATDFLCDLAISKFASILGGLDAVRTPEELEKELKFDPLLRKDLKAAMTWVQPLIPFLGLLSGGATVGKHMWDRAQAVDKRSTSEGVNVAEDQTTDATN